MFENRAAPCTSQLGENLASGGDSFNPDDGVDWEHAYSDTENGPDLSWTTSGQASDLIEAPRKIAQLGINYARASKQVPSLMNSPVKLAARESCLHWDLGMFQ